ncbi:oligopeptide/dipeptide ABC transporter ATP-binding protein [Streptomyces sp. NPDC055815]
MESGRTRDVLERPRHPYTRALIDASPTLDPVRERNRERIVLYGDPVTPAGTDTACAFRHRCPLLPSLDSALRGLCEGVRPGLARNGPRGDGRGRLVACHADL